MYNMIMKTQAEKVTIKICFHGLAVRIQITRIHWVRGIFNLNQHNKLSFGQFDNAKVMFCWTKTLISNGNGNIQPERVFVFNNDKVESNHWLCSWRAQLIEKWILTWDRVHPNHLYFLTTHHICNKERYSVIWHVNNIPTMRFFTGIPRNAQSKSYMQSLTECAWDFQNNELSDTD